VVGFLNGNLDISNRPCNSEMWRPLGNGNTIPMYCTSN
jgi:hypothetical protein